MRNIERVKYSIGHRVDKDYKNQKGWEKVSLKDIDTSRPVVLCFGGNGIINDRVTNSVAKLTERLLGINKKDKYIDIYSMNYGGVIGLNYGEITPQERREIVEGIFIPLVSNKGKKNTVDEASKNMRNINIFTHCFGAKAVNLIMATLVEKMKKKLKYTEPEVQQILSQVLHVSYSPMTNNYYPTNFEVKSFNDEKFGDKFAKNLEGFDVEETDPIKNFKPYLGCGKLVVRGNSVVLYAVSFLGEKSRESEHDTDIIARDENWSVENHRADTASQCIATSLALGIVNSKQNQSSNIFTPLPTVEEIKDLMQTTIDSANSSAREQKQKAIYDEQRQKFMKHWQLVPFEEYPKSKEDSENREVEVKSEVNTIDKRDASNMVMKREDVNTDAKRDEENMNTTVKRNDEKDMPILF